MWEKLHLDNRLNLSQIILSTFSQYEVKSIGSLESRSDQIWKYMISITAIFIKQMEPLAYNDVSIFAGALCRTTIGWHIAVTKRVKWRKSLISFSKERMYEIEPITYVLFGRFCFI